MSSELSFTYYHGGEKRYGAEGGIFQPLIAIAPTLASLGEKVHSLPSNRTIE
jgi:hypothetical protein